MPRTIDRANSMNRNAPLNRGCVGWYMVLPWRDGRWFNLAQNRNHGQLKGGASYTNTGSAGTLRPGGYGSVSFDNSDDYVLLRSGGILATKTNASVFAWVYRNVAGGTDTIYGERNGNALWRLQCNGLGANKIEFYHRDDAATLSGGASTTSVNSGEPWAHVGITKIGTGITFYRNGAADGTMTISGTDTLTISETDIGREKADGAYWPGRLDDVRLYERALTATEVKQLYDASRTGYQRELNWMDTPYWLHAAAAGGTTYTFASSDSIAYSDSLAVLTSSFRDTSDSIGIADDAVRACQVFRTAEDNVALSDTVDRACQNLRSVEDNVACSDTVERVVEYFRAVADSIGIADDVLREISGIREISVSDSLAISEAYLQVVSYFRDLADSLAFTEDFQRQVDYYRQVSDSIAILEELITALNGIVIAPPEEEEEAAAALDVEEDLYAYLLGCHLVTNLIGTRLYPVEAPQEATRPFIVYEILTRDRDDTQAGENGLVRVGIQFDCQAATYTAVREIEEALRGRFYRFYHRRMGTTFVQSAEISDATDEDSPPVFADALGVYHSRVDLELWYEEVAIADGTEA